jgi:hypothetical protein
MAYSKAKLKITGYKALPFLWTILNRKIIGPLRTLVRVSFKHILFNLTGLMGNPNYINILCNTSLLPATLGPGVHSATNRNKYHMQKIIFLGNGAQPVCRADNFTVIFEPIL